MPVERIISAGLGLSGARTVLQGTVGEVRRGGRRPVRVPRAGVSRNHDVGRTKWMDFTHADAQVWAEGGGIVATDREVVKNRLRDNGFYDGLTTKNSILDLAVGAQSYLDADLVPPGATVIAADISQAMLDALKASQEKSGVQLHTDFRVMDATLLDDSVGSLDRMLATFMMRYLAESEQREAVLRMVEKAKDGGRIDIIDFGTVENHLRHEKSSFTPACVEEMFGNPFFERGLADLGAQIDMTMHELPRPRQPFPARMYHLRLDVRK